MKRLNQFDRLPTEDRNLVLDLCAKHPYYKVAEILAQPRDQGGLSLVTSDSSLCKFFTRHSPDAVVLQATGQYAAAIQVNQQAHGEANFEAILGLVQSQILAALRQGKSVAELDKEFRSLARVQQCFLADAKYRHENQHTASNAYLEFVKAVAAGPDGAEFIRNDLPDDPGAGDATIEDFQEDLNQYQLDLNTAAGLPPSEITPTSTFLRAAARIVATLKQGERERAYIARCTGQSAAFSAVNSANPQQLLAMMKAHAAAAKASPASEISDSGPSKTPEISHISSDFSKPSSQEIHA